MIFIINTHELSEINLNEIKKKGYQKIIIIDKTYFTIENENLLDDIKFDTQYFTFDSIKDLAKNIFNENIEFDIKMPLIINLNINDNKYTKYHWEETGFNSFNTLELYEKTNLLDLLKNCFTILINNLYQKFKIFFKPFDFIRKFNLMNNTFNYSNEYFNKHLKFIGGSNISYALLNYFNCGKIYLRNLYDEFKKFNYEQKTIEDLIENDFEDEDIVIYTVTSKLNYGYNEEDFKKDVAYLNKIVQLCKYKNIKFIYFSSISIFKSEKNINIHTEFDVNNWYAKSKIECENIILKNILNINTYIIRPPIIQYYKIINKNKIETLINESLYKNEIEIRNSKNILQNAYTKPIQINKICQLINDIIMDYNKYTFYNIQGNELISFDDIANGKLYNRNINVIYKNQISNFNSRYFSNDFEYKIKQKNICVIIAGGKGERFGLINNLPKQFVEINGKKLIEITYENCHKYFDETYIVINEIYKEVKLNIPNEICYYVKSNHRIDTLIGFFKLKNFDIKDKICIKEANCPLLNVKLLLECLSQKQSCIGVYNMSSSNEITFKNNILNRNECYENEINVYNYEDILKFIQNEKKYNYQSEFEYLFKQNELIFKQTHMKMIKITYPEDLEFIQNLSNL